MNLQGVSRGGSIVAKWCLAHQKISFINTLKNTEIIKAQCLL